MTNTVTGNVSHPYKPLRGQTFTSNAPSGISIDNPRSQTRDHYRAPLTRANTLTQFGDIIVDFEKVEAHKAGVIVELTAHEFKALRYFLERTGLVISREQFLIDVLGYDAYPTTRTVDNHIYKLRQKLEPEPDHPIYFRTVRGMGYRFVGDAAPRTARSITNSLDPKPHPGEPSTDAQTALLNSLLLLYHLMIHDPRTP